MAQAKALWINNDTPGNSRYVSRIELATAARTDFVTAQLSRSSSFDQSRNL